MTRSHARGRGRALGLRALRVVRRHYFSLLSAGVLGAALVVALTSSSLDVGSESPAQRASAAQTTPATPAAPPWPTQAPPPELHLLVYYLVDSHAARDELLMAKQSDVTYWGQRGVPSMAGEVHEVLVVTNPEEEAAAMVFLDDLWKLAQVEDFALHFVDLR